MAGTGGDRSTWSADGATWIVPVEVPQRKGPPERIAAYDKAGPKLNAVIQIHPRAREIALLAGLNYVYTGNVHDTAGGSTYCPSCEQAVIVRDWYDIRDYRLDEAGACTCGARIAGRFQKFGKPFGPRRIPVRLAAAAA